VPKHISQALKNFNKTPTCLPAPLTYQLIWELMSWEDYCVLRSSSQEGHVDWVQRRKGQVRAHMWEKW